MGMEAMACRTACCKVRPDMLAARAILGAPNLVLAAMIDARDMAHPRPGDMLLAEPLCAWKQHKPGKIWNAVCAIWRIRTTASEFRNAFLKLAPRIQAQGTI
eukprot:CAMPEP_0115384012 /NCGR_PEP_ID=MMETSP0271-20121206/6888_1 /TAXON_ID=71861 /ORGANISM="Scrippsiella trochoidea, Strain CCMP3099" /LENGTH=101 /DNA_ID=CAMNT_0002807353 /DNA_START=188 /DNA_END=493 /DNA_ORIENTATION=-